MVDISIVNWYLDGPWDFADSWLVTGDLLPTKYPNETIHLLIS